MWVKEVAVAELVVDCVALVSEVVVLVGSADEVEVVVEGLLVEEVVDCEVELVLGSEVDEVATVDVESLLVVDGTVVDWVIVV